MSNGRFQIHGAVWALVLLGVTMGGAAPSTRAQDRTSRTGAMDRAPATQTAVEFPASALRPATSLQPASVLQSPSALPNDGRVQSSGASDRSGLRAFGLNLLVPGLGQRYLNGGEWTGWGALFAGVDAALWLGLTGTVWHRSHAIDSYRMLARSRAGADLTGKDRPFFLQMAQHRSQEAYVEHLLRSRQWGELSSAEEASRFWVWDSQEAWEEYRDTRSTADALSRRRSTYIAGLVAHRLLTGLAALLSARNDGEAGENGAAESGGTGESNPARRAASSRERGDRLSEHTSLTLEPPSFLSSTPRLKLTLRW